MSLFKHYFAPKSFADFRKEFNNAFPEKEEQIRHQYTDW
jgi:hypothetical protein